MCAEAPVQGLAQGRQFDAKAAAGELGQRCRVVVTGGQLLKNLPANMWLVSALSNVSDESADLAPDYALLRTRCAAERQA